MSSSQFEFLDFSDLEENDYQSLLSIIDNETGDVNLQSSDISECQDKEEIEDTEAEYIHDSDIEDFLKSSKRDGMSAGISFFVDGGSAEDIDLRKTPPPLAVEETGEIPVYEQDKMIPLEEQVNLYTSDSVAPPPPYISQPPVVSHVGLHNLNTVGGLPVYNMPHHTYMSHSGAAGPVQNQMYPLHPPSHAPHYVPPTVYVENCHVNFSPYGSTQPPGTLYPTPPPSYQGHPHQPVYSQYVVADQSALSLQAKTSHDRHEYDHGKRGDLNNRGNFRGRPRGRGRRRGREEHERSNSVSSDHSTYSDSGVKSYKETAPPPTHSSANHYPLYTYYPVSYAVNPLTRQSMPLIPPPHYVHEPYSTHQSLMTYPPPVTGAPTVSYEQSNQVHIPQECEQFNQENQMSDPYVAMHQHQEMPVSTQHMYIESSSQCPSQANNCIYSESRENEMVISYGQETPVPVSFEQPELVENLMAKPSHDIYKNDSNYQERYEPQTRESPTKLNSEQSCEDPPVSDESGMRVGEVPFNGEQGSDNYSLKGNIIRSESINTTQPDLGSCISSSNIISEQLQSEKQQNNHQVNLAETNGCKNFAKESELSPCRAEMSSSTHSLSVRKSVGSSEGIVKSDIHSPRDCQPGSISENGTRQPVSDIPDIQRTFTADEISKENCKTDKLASSKPYHRKSSPHAMHCDTSYGSCSISDAGDCTPPTSPSGLPMNKPSSKGRDLETKAAPQTKSKSECSDLTSNVVKSRSSSKESQKDFQKSSPTQRYYDTSAQKSHQHSSFSEQIVKQGAQQVVPETAWGQKKCWSQLFKPTDEALSKQIAYVTPFNAKEGEKDSDMCRVDSHTNGNLGSDGEVEKSKVGALLKNYSPDYRPVQLQPRGLINKNYWCYVNAPLQALLACPSLFQLMQLLSREAGYKSGNTATPFINSVVDYVTEFSTMPPQAKVNRKEKGAAPKKEPEIVTGTPFEPTCMYKMLINCKENQFTEGRQQDAEEMLSCVLNGLHDEMVESLKLAGAGLPEPAMNGTVNGDASLACDITEEDAEWKVQGPKKKSCVTRTAHFSPSPISQIFWGRLRSVLLQAGGNTTANLQPFNTLPLDIQSPKVDTLKDALSQLVTKEEISGFTCPKTNQEVTASNQVTLEDLPRVLILHLKRFIYDKDGGLQKVTKRLQFPIDLEITKELLSGNSRGKFSSAQRKFKLFAVVNHEGKEATKGHYVVDVFHTGYNCWLRFDDSSVKPIPEMVVLRHEPPRVPYLLFYRRSDTLSSPTCSNNSSSSNSSDNKVKN